jgi:ribosomal protein S18 acetylase RimI-like enzyme
MPPEIIPFMGTRTELLELFRLADDSDAAIASYLEAGDVLVAVHDGRIVGHVQILVVNGAWQINSVAVVDAERCVGLGRRLVEAGMEHARTRGARAIEVATATADVGLLRFYQRLGFRMTRIERDVFTPAAGYPAELFVEGVRVLDRVWFDQRLDGARSRARRNRSRGGT